MTEFCLRTIAIAILLALHPILGENVSQNHSQLHTSFDDVALSEHGAVVALNRTAKNVPSTKQPEHQFEYHSGIDHHLGSDSVNLTNVLRLENVLEVFNIRDVAKLWEQHATDQFTTECANDMHAYLHGLQQRQLWATKMDDASGHYTTGLFYGNNYWTGSLSLCKSIYKTKIDSVVVRTRHAKDDVSFNAAYNPAVNLGAHDNPPFVPGFFVLKIQIDDANVVRVPRLISLGLCLPSKCTLDDVQQFTTKSQRSIANRQVSFVSIRSPTQDPFDLWNDTTFLILFTVSSIVGILLVTATIYELMLIHRAKNALKNKRRAKDDIVTDSSSGIGCTTYDLTSSVPNKGDLPIGIVIPRGMNNNNSDENLAEGSINVEEIKLSVWSELLLSFSIINNFKAICDRSVGSDTIPSIHGLRAISMAWVILGHTCIIVFKYSDNMELRKVVEKEFIFQTITNGAFSVDTFFFISGFLVSYIYFRTNAKGNLEKLSQGVSEVTAGTFHFFGLIIYRFVRLTAPYMFVLGCVEVVMKYFHHHSVFDTPTLDHENCPKYWWRNILYINTLFPVEDMCMLWSWYLADDTQFYIIGAIILIVAVRHFKVASSMLAFFMVSSWATTAYIAFENNHIPNTDDPLALFDKIYDKPWTRLGPYLVGMCVGWFLFKTNCKIRMRRSTVVVGWLSASFCLLWLIYGLYGIELSATSAAAYSSLSHSAWAMSLAWIVVACSSGYGGYVNTILSAPIIYPFSRVTYCAYLVHPIAIRFMALNSDSPLHLGADSMIVMFFGQVVLSYLLSFIISLSFEAPVVTMLKILTPNRKKILVENRD